MSRATPGDGGNPPSTLAFRSGGCTHRGHVRSYNEDASLSRPDLGLWAVADGMGGHARGDYASGQVTASLAAIEGAGGLAALVDAAEQAVQSAHRHLRDRGEAEGGMMGTTLVALLVRERHAVVIWAGDSRAYRLRQGALERISHDHSVVQSLVDQGLLHPDEASAHPLANRITRAVGAGDLLHLEMELLPVEDGDRFLLCSDGLDRYVDDSLIATTLRTHPDVQACSDSLVAQALDLGGGDNITCLVIDIGSGSHPGSTTDATQAADPAGG